MGPERAVHRAQVTAWTFAGWLLLAFGVFEIQLSLVAELTGFGDRMFFSVRPPPPPSLSCHALQIAQWPELCLQGTGRAQAHTCLRQRVR